MADKAEGAKRTSPGSPPESGNGEDARKVNAEAGKAAGGRPQEVPPKAAVGKAAVGSKDGPDGGLLNTPPREQWGPRTREDIQRAIEIGERVDRQIEQERLEKIRNRTPKNRGT